MSHVVLLGDSIFDNGVYVPGEPAVIDQVRQRISPNHTATLMAVDGAVTSDVQKQLARLPADATHLFISIGGNDALAHSHVLDLPADSIISELTRAHEQFHVDYRVMLDSVCQLNRPTTLCTIYDSVPALPRAAIMALSVFNDVILRSAFARCLPVIDLRLVCSAAEDYSSLSPIEPSSAGGRKIADRVVHVWRHHDFDSGHTSVY